jgi:hypothetical protein
LRLLVLLLVLAALSPAFSAPRINEFMAANSVGLKDEDGDTSDWIEIFNPDATPVSLAGYFLTDNTNKLNKWKFPAVTLNPGAFLTVFASGKDRIDPTKKLHTNFSLNRDGAYLGLVAPDALTILSELAPAYPPQFDDVSFGLGGSPLAWCFFTTPTPGSTNATGQRAGPVVTVTAKDPPQPVTGPLTITASVRALNDPVSSVKLYYRRMFATETAVTIVNNGDGTWSGVIPAGAFGPGEMTRWRISALDTKSTETKEPAFRLATRSPQYFGTVAQDSRIQSLLPVLHWFIQSPNNAGTDTGARGSLYYDGEFYDNVFFSLHGQSTAGFPKKSYNIDFNPQYHFRYKTNEARVSDIDLLTNWADKSKVRHVLAYEIMRTAGVAAHFAFTIRVQQNGSFFSTADFIERGNEDFLDRAGLNKDGALYKAYSTTLNKAAGDTGTSGVEKKTRLFEGNADLQALIDGLALSGTALQNYMWDNIDIPRCVDMMAANSVIRNIDLHVKNWYIYRDTGRSGEWAMLPWDLDLSAGRVWNTANTYFDNGLYTDGYVITGDSVRLVALMFQNPAMRSMLMRRIRTLSDQFLQLPPPAGTPESSLFYERRLNEQSALIDPPSIVPSDAERDFEKWGSWLQGGTVVSYTNTNVQVETMAEAITRWKREYLPARRAYIYNTQVVGKGGEIPLPQNTTSSYVYTPLLVTGAPVKAIVPADTSLGLNWIGSAGKEPYDTSSWLSGVTGVGYSHITTPYVPLIGLNVDSAMRSNNTIYIRVEFDGADPSTIDKLELRMKYDDGFVAFLNGAVLFATNSPASPQWNSAATVTRDANANVFEVFDVTSKKANLHTGKNILAIQGLNDSTNSVDFLIVPELHAAKFQSGVVVQPTIAFSAFDVSPVSGNQDQEFIQLTNSNSIAVDISDWHLAGGVEHNFTPGTVIPAKGSLYLTPNSAAFRARTVAPKGGQGLFIQGGYKGHLSNLGETVYLIDSTGATNSSKTFPSFPSNAQKYLVVSEFSYHPPGDGLAEFIELVNISPVTTIDLTNIHFNQGVDFNFTNSTMTTLAPGARALIVRDLVAFQAVYGTGLPVAGAFANSSSLDNGGEHLKLEDGNNQTVLEFTYHDYAPWPTSADGGGYTLVLKAPELKPDPNIATNWRASVFPGGTPGATDASAFPADPAGDANGNGEPDLLDYALGNDLGKPAIFPSVTVQMNGDLPDLRLHYPRSLGADRARIDVVYSNDLSSWQDATPFLAAGTTQTLGDGRVMMNWTVNPPLTENAQVYLRLKVTPL